MHKIYSRFRFRIPKIRKISISPNISKIRNSGLPKGGPLIKMIAILVVAFSTAILILNAIEPIFRKLCEEKAKAIATIVSNQQASEVIKKYSYEDLFSIERDKDGNIRMIKSNIIPMNEISSDVPNRIQLEINNMGKDNIQIPLRKFYRN